MGTYLTNYRVTIPSNTLEDHLNIIEDRLKIVKYRRSRPGAALGRGRLPRYSTIFKMSSTVLDDLQTVFDGIPRNSSAIIGK